MNTCKTLKIHLALCVASVATLFASPSPAKAQSVLFNFDNAPDHTPLPLSLTEGGVTAYLSATGQGFSIQPVNAYGFTPIGFSGLCVSPNSIYAADLIVSFSRPLTAFSILYAPEEYGCDTSARMRVSAYINGLTGSFVGTATTNASQPGTWPSETLAFSSTTNFDTVVVHYDAGPSCTDIGPVFMLTTCW